MIYVCRNGSARHLASGSMDKTVRIWDTILGQTLRILSSHTEAVSALRWGGTGLIYSGSRDKTIKVWRSVDVCNKIFVFDNRVVTVYCVTLFSKCEMWCYILGCFLSEFGRSCTLGELSSIKYRLCNENWGF